MNDQRSLSEQLIALVLLANANGLYDAADWVIRTRERNRVLGGPIPNIPESRLVRLNPPDDLPSTPKGNAR